MFQCIEESETRSIWTENPLPSLGMGLVRATRILIETTPDGRADIQQGGTCFEATLAHGMWPDNWELMLMILGYSPGSDESNQFLMEIAPVPFDAEDKTSMMDAGIKRLLAGFSIMPVFVGAANSRRVVYQNVEFVRGTAANEVLNLERTAPAGQNVDAMSYQEWVLQIDLNLYQEKQPCAGSTKADNLPLKDWHSEGMTPDDATTSIINRRTSFVDVGENAS